MHETEATSTYELSENFSPLGYLEKTLEAYFLQDGLTNSERSWKTLVTKQKRTVSQLVVRLVRHTNESESSLWPTHVAAGRTTKYNQGGTPITAAVFWAENWPTPTARDWKDGQSGEKTKAKSGRPLSEVAMYWPTPTASMAFRGDCAAERRRKDPHLGSQVAIQQNSPMGKNKPQLNPDWVETLMGFPIGWSTISGPRLEEYFNSTGNRRALQKLKQSEKSE